MAKLYELPTLTRDDLRSHGAMKDQRPPSKLVDGNVRSMVQQFVGTNVFQWYIQVGSEVTWRPHRQPVVILDQTPRWVPVPAASVSPMFNPCLPPLTVPFPLWGTKLTVGLDHPIMGWLCACHTPPVWVLDWGCKEDRDEEEFTERMLGTVTHWLDWRPGPQIPR